jgi:hypothetical protein
MSACLEERPKVELSDDAREQLEEMCLSAFHDLLISVTNAVTRQLELSAHHVAALQIDGVEDVRKALAEAVTDAPTD